MAKYTTAIILDNRYPRKKDSKMPVKLRVIIDRKSRYYGLGYYLSEDEFYNKVYSAKPRNKYKDILKEITKEEDRAISLLEAMEMPNFEQFKRLFAKKGDGGNVKMYFEQRIKELKEYGKYGTADLYAAAQKSFSDIKGAENIGFKAITPDWLRDYANKMIAAKKSRNTISIYTRCLQFLYNRAIRDGIIAQKYYPFGKEEDGKFKKPRSEKNKRPLQKNEIFALANYAGNPFLEYYRDFFMLSYYLIGLNFADLLPIKWEQIDDNTLTVTRQKTAYQAREHNFKLYIPKKAWDIINRYCNKDSEFVFDIATSKDPEKQKKQIKNFTRNCNQSLKKIAKVTGINPKISPIFARHSAATHGMVGGANIGDISQGLGHTDITTTINYLESLEGADKSLAETLEQNTVQKKRRGTKRAKKVNN